MFISTKLRRRSSRRGTEMFEIVEIVEIVCTPIVLFILIFFPTSIAQGWTLPPVTLMPWVTQGISHEKNSQQRSAINEASQKLADSLGKNASLDTLYSEGNPNTIKSLKTRLSLFRGITELHDAQLDKYTKKKNILIQPFFCSFGQESVVLTLVSSAEKWLTLSVASQIVANSTDLQEQKYNLSIALAKATGEAISEAFKATDFEHNLKFSIHPETSGENVGNPTCTHLLIMKKMLNYAHFTPEADASDYGKIVSARPSPALLPSRSTRKLMVHIDRLDADIDQEFSAKIRVIESVLGRTYPNPIELNLKLSKENNQIELSSLEPLIEFAKKESQVLGYESEPEIIHKNKAWVYVDKGRAWGLKIGDRLIRKGNEIKGHVVAYYGPEMQLKDSKGNTIIEGAIIYIRKGQDLTKIGQKLTWDPRAFPTPWPPPAQ